MVFGCLFVCLFALRYHLGFSTLSIYLVVTTAIVKLNLNFTLSLLQFHPSNLNVTADYKGPNKQTIPVACPSGLSDRSSSDSAGDVRPLSTTTTGGVAGRPLLLERMLPTRLSSFVWMLKLICPQVTSCKENKNKQNTSEVEHRSMELIPVSRHHQSYCTLTSSKALTSLSLTLMHSPTLPIPFIRSMCTSSTLSSGSARTMMA